MIPCPPHRKTNMIEQAESTVKELSENKSRKFKTKKRVENVFYFTNKRKPIRNESDSSVKEPSEESS